MTRINEQTHTVGLIPKLEWYGVAVYDGEDNVMVQVLSSNGDVFKTNVISTSLTAKVYKGGQNITDFIDNSKFSWIKINSDESIDPTWSKTGKTVKLTSSDVSSRATFICTVSI